MTKESDLRSAFSSLLNVKNHVYFAEICNFSVTTAFQPIYDTEQQLVGYEALLRPYSEGVLVSAYHFLKVMRAGNEIAFTDRLIRALHLRNFALLHEQSDMLFLNYEFESITDLKDIQAYKNLLVSRKKEIGIDDTCIVIEVLEHDVSSEQNLKTMSNWHRHNHAILIAMDDMTDRESDWARLINIQPEIVKIDISMLQSPNYRSFVDRLKQFDLKILQEGIETAEEKALALSAGADYLQGYFIGYPTLINEIDNKKHPLSCEQQDKNSRTQAS